MEYLVKRDSLVRNLEKRRGEERRGEERRGEEKRGEMMN